MARNKPLAAAAWILRRPRTELLRQGWQAQGVVIDCEKSADICSFGCRRYRDDRFSLLGYPLNRTATIQEEAGL